MTDSFHACVFSILFRKQFIVYGNQERGMTRFHSLLSILGLEDRLVYDYSQYKKQIPIDYDAVYTKLNTWRTKSLELLNQSMVTHNNL